MAVYSILPNTGHLKKSDIRDTLNANGGVCDNEFSSLFKASSNINKWARYKPESYNALFRISDHERYMNNYGFDITYLSTGGIEDVFNRIKNGQAWSYVLPRGGRTSPYRINDFRGYNPKAAAPFDYHWISKSGETTKFPYSESWRVVVNSDSEIKMSDLSVFDDLHADYYMFIARKAVGSNYTYIASSMVSRIGDPSDVICNISFPSEGQWECVFCLGQNTSDEIHSRTDLKPMPDGYFVFNLTKKAAWISVTYISPNPPYVTYYSDSYMLNLGTTYFELSLRASDTSVSIPLTELKFGFHMTLLDRYGYDVAMNEIFAEDGADKITYQGTGTVSWRTVNFPQFIYLTNYFNSIDIENAYKIRLRPIVEAVSGDGVPSVNNIYFEFNLQ